MQRDAILSDPSLELITTFLFSTGLDQPPAGLAGTASRPLSYCYLLPYGIDRLRAAAVDFGWPKVTENLNQPDRTLSLAREVQAHVVGVHGEAASDPAKRFIVRLAFKRDGIASFMSAPRPNIPGVPYYPLSLPSPGSEDENDVPVIPLHLDPGYVESSLFTKHKTSYRAEYDEARKRVGFDDTVGFAAGEMLLQNERGEIMGGGVSTVYLWRDGCWVTPAAETGCKLGVSRRWALEHAGVREGVVMARYVREGELVWLSSAVGGFRQGKVTLKPRGVSS
jgi:hypothetical protein